MSHYYPVALDLKDRRCLVVGGGKIATEKVEGLMVTGAMITVVSPEVSRHIEAVADSGHIVLHRRPYNATDLQGIYLAYGATDDRAVNARVAQDARARGIIVNAVDDIPNCDFFAVAIVRRGDLQVSISTNGRSPAFARWMREYLDESLPLELKDLLDVLGDAREELKSRGPVPEYHVWQKAISDDVMLRLRSDDKAGARRRVLDVLMAVEGQPHLDDTALAATQRVG